MVFDARALLPGWARKQAREVRTAERSALGARAVFELNLPEQGHCFIKVYRNPDAARIEAMVQGAATAFDRAEIGVARVVGAADHWIATEAADGVSWWNAATTGKDRFYLLSLTKSMGDWLKHFHGADWPDELRRAVSSRPPIDTSQLGANALAYLETANTMGIVGDSLCTRLCSALAQTAERIPLSADRHVVTHGDFCPPQFLVSVRRPYGWIIDFERALVDMPETDVAFWLAKARLHRIQQPRFSQFGSDAERAFLQGYGREHLAPLTLDALTLLFTLRLIRPLFGRSPRTYLLRHRWRAEIELRIAQLENHLLSSN